MAYSGGVLNSAEFRENSAFLATALATVFPSPNRYGFSWPANGWSLTRLRGLEEFVELEPLIFIDRGQRVGT